MLRHCSSVISLAAMLVGLSTAEAADTVLTLACKGTVTETVMGEEKQPEPISVGLIFNFTKRSVQGFGYGVEIKSWDEVSVSFGHFKKDPVTKNVDQSMGTIDRITGDLEASFLLEISKEAPLDVTKYTLKCRPGQRMF
jgi:hypothetical protein